MDIIRGNQQLAVPPKHPVVTIGNFDGVHVGHQQIVHRAIERARAKGGTAIAYTFRPHPQLALRPESGLKLLTTYDEKLEILGKLGINLMIEEPFSREFSTTPPEQFFDQVLRNKLGAEAIVVGYDFGFGQGRQGQLDILREFCARAGITLEIVQPQAKDGEVASSSKVRQYLLTGDLPSANRLLGREYFYRGIVERGDSRGKKLGFPTANLALPESKVPLPNGVYATRVVLGGRTLPSVTNIGIRPTFQKSGQKNGQKILAPLIETHVLDQDLDLYGEPLEVRFVKRLRDEVRFPGVDALREQIEKDVSAAREALK